MTTGVDSMCLSLVKVLGARGFPLVAWDICTIPQDRGGLGLIDVATQGSILAAKWVVQSLEGSTLWQVLFQHRILTA